MGGGETRAGVAFEDSQGEYTLSLRALLEIVWRRLWVIALMTALFTGAAVGFSLLQKPIYQSSAEILVDRGEESSTGGNIQTDVQGLQQLVGTVVQAVDSRRVAEAVIREQDLQDDPYSLLANLSVEEIPDTHFIQIYFKDTDPQRAREMADAFARAASEQISEVSPRENAISATVWEPAVLPNDPVSPQPVRNGLLALMLGIAIGIGLAFVLEHLDDSWQSPEEMESVSGVPTFGVIPKFEAPKDKAAKKRGGRRG